MAFEQLFNIHQHIDLTDYMKPSLRVLELDMGSASNSRL